MPELCFLCGSAGLEGGMLRCQIPKLKLLFYIKAVVSSCDSVPELCFLCGSAGLEGGMLRCLACCEPAHPFCLSQVSWVSSTGMPSHLVPLFLKEVVRPPVMDFLFPVDLASVSSNLRHLRIQRGTATVSPPTIAAIAV